MKKPIEIIANAADVPEYSPSEVTALMERLGVNERAFALLMNVSPMTVRLWTSGAAKPSGLSRRLMQIFDCCPSVINSITDENKDGGNI